MNVKSVVLTLLANIILLVLPGCESTPVKPVEPAPVTPPPAPVDKRTEILNQLLSRADHALAMQYLTEPVTGNAYDLYKAALRVDPGNARATEGLNKVADAYGNLIGESLRGKQFDAANRQIQRAVILFPGNSQIKALEADVKKARQAAAPAASPKPAVAGPNQFLLPGAELKAQSKSVEALLQGIAKRVEKSDESVLIFARSDVEGRWIYKVMRQAVGDYRIRGDIKISGTPSVQLQAPIP